MNILALDSTTEACSVALLSGQSVFEKFEMIGRGHAEHLLPMMNSVLQENNASLAEIDLFAYSAGPGSFTGIRRYCSSSWPLQVSASSGDERS